MAHMTEPWWAERARLLLNSQNLPEMDLGSLWRISLGLVFIRENVDGVLLEEDLRVRPDLAPLWHQLKAQEGEVGKALEAGRTEVADLFRHGKLSPESFLARWHDMGECADDYLDGLLDVARLTVGEECPPSGHVNMASRAERIWDFLSVVKPTAKDTVYDLGSGNGKFAVTLAASCCAHVKGVEYGPSYVESARRTAARLGLRNIDFVCADVRETALDDGTAFYLFHPFSGDVAKRVAGTLAALAVTRPLTIYAQGPEYGFGEYFLQHAQTGALRLLDRRGEYAQGLVLASRH